MRRFHALSVSHRSATLAELEQAALSPSTLSWLDSRLTAERIQAVALTTCHRTELFWWERGARDRFAMTTAISEVLGSGFVEQKAVRLSGAAAARHLFRISAGLESVILGEAEILGQVRTAAERAAQVGTMGPELGMLFRAGVRFGREARATTRIGVGSLSLASAAVRVVQAVIPDLSQATVLVVGAGDTGFRTARHLAAERVGRCVVLNRTAGRAHRVAEATGAMAAPLTELCGRLSGADAVIAAIRVARPILTAAALRACLDESHTLPRIVVDLSLPRAVDPGVRGVPGVRLHDLSELTDTVNRHLTRRQAEVPRVEAMLEHALSKLSWALERRRAFCPVPGEPRRAEA